jgi:uncharacterized protein (DUF1684 family)
LKLGFKLAGRKQTVARHWLDGNVGGYFLPIVDATSGVETRGAGRYLLDTMKDRPRHHRQGRARTYFNDAYNPHCCYNKALGVRSCVGHALQDAAA